MVKLHDIYKVLRSIKDGDYYVEQFMDGDLREDMLTAFVYNNLVWIASNERVIITPHGEKCLHEHDLSVDSNKKKRKIKKNYE